MTGMDAGTVTRIDVPSRPEGKFRIYFKIIEKLHPIVRQDSVVTIQTDGRLGNKYLQIDAGSSQVAQAKENAMIQGREPFDWGDLMDDIKGVVTKVSTIVEGVKEEVLATLSEVKKTVSTANLLIKQARPHVNSIMASADKIGSNLNLIIDGIQAGRGTVGALIKDEEVYASIKRSVTQTDVVRISGEALVVDD